jgi:fructoselysine-6-phosphate deglycase
MAHAITAVQPIQADYLDTLNFALSQRPQIEALTADLARTGVTTVYLVGAGGSLSVMYPLQFLFDQRATAFATSLATSAEFVVRTPAALGPQSLVLVASHTGTTPETVEAAALARARGARVVAFTRLPDSRLATTAGTAFTYGSDHTVTEAKSLLLYQLGLSLLDRFGQAEDLAGATAALNASPAALLQAKQQSEGRNAETAARYKDEPLIYVLSAGPNYGVGYAFAMCYLQEMQWMHAASIHAGEFFHGAFEIVEQSTPLLLLLGEDASRPIAERALRFAKQYSGKVVTIDTKELSLPGIPDRFRGLFSPVALSAVTSRLAAHFAALRGHPLETRRYMFKVEY